MFSLHGRKLAIGTVAMLVVCFVVVLMFIAWTQKPVDSAAPIKPVDRQALQLEYKATLDQINTTYQEKRTLINNTYNPRLTQLWRQDRDTHGKLVLERNKALKQVLDERNEAQRIAWDEFKEKQLEWLVID